MTKTPLLVAMSVFVFWWIVDPLHLLQRFREYRSRRKTYQYWYIRHWYHSIDWEVAGSWLLVVVIFLCVLVMMGSAVIAGWR